MFYTIINFFSFVYIAIKTQKGKKKQRKKRGYNGINIMISIKNFEPQYFYYGNWHMN